MAEKIDIDGVRFKVEADLSKLEGDLKKGEGAAKKGGENLGKAAGQGFAGTLKSNTSSALNSIEGQAGTMGSKVSGVFAKIGVAAAAAFAVDKVITFFKSAVDEAEKAEKASGKVGKGAADSFKKAEADIDAAIVNIKQVIGGPLLALVRTVYDAVATILGGITKMVNAIADAFTTKDADQIAEAFQKQKKELQALGSEMDRLGAINKRTADQELELIKLKETLTKRAEALGVSYNELAKDAKNYSDVVKEVEKIERARAKAEIGRIGTSLQGGLGYLEQQRDTLKQDMERAKARGDRVAIQETRRELAELEPRIVRQRQAIDDTLKRFKNIDEPIKTDETGGGGGSPSGQEARFIDSRLRLVTIEENRAYTIKKAYADKLSNEETERRIFMANEEARQATEYELGSLRQGYAQFIEDTHMAKLEALKSEADNAKRLSFNLLEAELKQAGANEEKKQKAKEANAKRLAEIESTERRKNFQNDAESFARTMNAANATTTGLANIANAKNAGGAIGGAGGLLSGVSGFSDKFKGLGIIGSGISAIGGIVGTLTSLFGKSDEERQREADEQRRRDEQAQAILELQATYQKNMLSLQEAQSKQPFENLQRQLRLIDIEASKQKLAGVDQSQIDSQRLSARQAAFSGTLQSEASSISAGDLFRGTGSSHDALISFLNKATSQVAPIQGFLAVFERFYNAFYNKNGLTYAQTFSIWAELQKYQGQVPNEFFQAIDGLDPNKTVAGSHGLYGYNSAGQVTDVQAVFASAKANLPNFQAETTRDIGTAENLLSVIEQSLQTNIEIEANTKKTAENTTKLVETPQRQSSIIDISRGYTRSLGQILNPGITNTGLPSSIQAAVLATDIQKSIQERSLDKLQSIENIQRDSRELLAIIAKGVNTTASGSLLAELESLYRRSIAA